jgi:hypothetical protein
MKKEYNRGGDITQALRGVVWTVHRRIHCGHGPLRFREKLLFLHDRRIDSPRTDRLHGEVTSPSHAEELAFLRCRKNRVYLLSYNLFQFMTALENVTTPMAFGAWIPTRGHRAWICWLVGLKERCSTAP